MSKPPPVIDTSRVLAYAINDDDVIYTARITIFVGSVGEELERLGEVPNLAIVQPYNDPGEHLLLFCDEDWNSKGSSDAISVKDAKEHAERGYQGIAAKWIDMPYTQEETDEYLRYNYGVNPNTRWWEETCSFCDKKDTEVSRMVQRNRVTICDSCIKELYALITKESS